MKHYRIAGLALAALILGTIAGCAMRTSESDEASIGSGFINPREMMPREGSDAYKQNQPADGTNPVTMTAPESSRNSARGSFGSSAADMLAPNSLPAKDEELWIIEKKPKPDEPARATDDKLPGTGSLMARLHDVRDANETVPVPLKHTDVKASIAGYIATVDVTQQFHNPYPEKIEAIYVFPLPHNAAVNEFLMTVGQRKIRGLIRERQEAERIYNEAKSQGYVASLLTQERPNIFTQSVANIEPGKQIRINIKYFHTLSYVDGWYEYVFPMVVGPRFNPPGFTEGVGAVGRGANGASGQKTEVRYLRPHERSGHDISLSVHIDAGVNVENVECKTHQVNISPEPTAGQADIKLAASDTIPNRDFILRYKVAGRTIKSAVMVQRDPKEKGAGWFTLMLFPPDSMNDVPRKPLEMVFTIDVSGSQAGIPLQQEKAAVKYALRHLGPEDTFQVIRFGNTSIKCFPQPVPADPHHVSQAIPWIDALDAREGTMLVEGLRASLIFPHDASRLRYVTFLTDGFIGNETEALSEIHRELGPSRIFSFGSGSSTNRYLLEHMAKLGNGAAAYLGPRDNAEEVMATFLSRISHPAMTDLSLDFGNLQVTDVYPQRLTDLYVGRPVTITGRFTHSTGPGDIRIRGTIAGEKREIPIPVSFDQSQEHQGIASVWARMKIADLADRSTYESIPELPNQIKDTALTYGLLSSFTAFVAVDSSAKTPGDHGTTIAVPVNMPEGVRYDTTVTEKP